MGFRPYAYRMATERSLKGWVCNGSDGVHLEVNASGDQAMAFCAALVEHAPGKALIRDAVCRPAAPATYADFRILGSEDAADTYGLLVAPDFAPCRECIAEMYDPDDRRYGYPFITCTGCGPRYSVIRSLPYDRQETSMSAYVPCEACEREYHDPEDRRFHSQTNSCPACGIRMHLYEGGRLHINPGSGDILVAVTDALKAGRIVAVKGVGGYLLLCDASDGDVIRLLRQRKQRPHKPFAVMYPDEASVARSFDLMDAAREELCGSASPIVLLMPGAAAADQLQMEAIAPGLGRIGVMLPSSPLLRWIADSFGRALVATSGNISGSPIIHQDDQALRLLASVADLILTHDREILMPQDDSVMQFSPSGLHRIILRRSRGLPLSLHYQRVGYTGSVLATGALLKSTFTLARGEDAFTSQYLGNTDSYEARSAYRETVSRMMHLLKVRPEAILADLHPGYFAHEFAEEMGKTLQVPVAFIQHHRAHAAAVLAENGLLSHAGPVLCVIWDGTGLGDDGSIWGGEFFIYHDGALERILHFADFPVIAGDKMAAEPRLSALSLCMAGGLESDGLTGKFTREEWSVYRRLASDPRALRTTSVGRLFDAVASLVCGCDRQSHEGQAAMQLEHQAAAYLQRNGTAAGWDEEAVIPVSGQIPTAAFMAPVFRDIGAGMEPGRIAARFHQSLVRLICEIAALHRVRTIACSGGVFQNALLADLLAERIGDGIRVCHHRQLSPNDESISFGQLAYWDHDIDGCRSVAKGNETKSHAMASAYSSTIKKRDHVFGNTRTDQVH